MLVDGSPKSALPPIGYAVSIEHIYRRLSWKGIDTKNPPATMDSHSQSVVVPLSLTECRTNIMVDAKGGGMPSAPSDASDQPTLRVMRLYKPRLDSRRVLPSCNLGDAGDDVRGHGVCVADAGQEDFALSSSLKLPDSFGNIYLGETFTAYIRYALQLAVTVVPLSATLEWTRMIGTL